ncbi:hypothetical protein JCM18909_2122 [Cutibacterium acnes JCM 18909]|nr:hypothetical protein JCM18909_2122 [Cutibacterium acnes JCM 18909]
MRSSSATPARAYLVPALGDSWKLFRKYVSKGDYILDPASTLVKVFEHIWLASRIRDEWL